MTIDVFNKEGKKIDTMTLPESVFGVRWNAEAVHTCLVVARGNARKPIAHTKDRGEVSGGGKKPWRQKGTGRSRHGSSRSPIWKGGGTTFGPTNERVFERKINKKMKQFALTSLLSRKLKDNKVTVYDSLDFKTGKTKLVADFLRKRTGEKASVLLVRSSGNQSIIRGARNIPRVSVESSSNLDISTCALREKIIFERPALEAFILRATKETQVVEAKKK